MDTVRINRIVYGYIDLNKKINALSNNPSKNNLKDLSKKIATYNENYISDSIYLNHFVQSNYETANSYFDKQNLDSALYFYSLCHKVISKYKKINYFNYKKLYKSMFVTTIKKNISSANYFFFQALNNGNDDIEDLITYSQYNKEVKEDSLLNLLHILNTNYLKNNHKSRGDIDILFRYINFMDQYYRILCYSHKKIKYNIVQSNDSTLQLLFSNAIENIDNLNIFDGTFYQPTFAMLLVHSTATPQTDFFEKYFSVYAQFFSNNFKPSDSGYNGLQTLLDMYLKNRYEKQYFNTNAGQGLLPNNTWGQLPQIDENELKKIFGKLNIKNPIYK